MNFLKRNLDIIIVVVLGFVLRFAISCTHSYSNDELSAINRLEYSNLDELIEFGVKIGDMHPAGVQLFMKGWSQIAGVNELGMRLPFVLFGSISILLIFLLGKTYINRNAGLIAAIFLALLYFPIMNSEFARPYSPGLLFSLCSAWFYLKILFDQQRKFKHAIFLGLFVVAAMYTHYYAFMFVGWLGLSGLIFLKRENIKHVLVASLLAILLFLPHLEITTYHLGVGGLQWLGPPETNWLFQFLFHAFNESWLVITGIALILLLTLFFHEGRAVLEKKTVLLIAIWFFGIYLIGHFYSIFYTPILKFPVMLFSFPFFLLLLAIPLSQFRYQNLLLPSFILLLGTSTVREKDLFGNMHYELFEEIAEDIVRWNKKYGESDIYTVYNLNNPNYMNFYANRWGEEIPFHWDVIEFGDAKAIREDLLLRKEKYCIVGYSGRLTLPQVFETCKEFYPIIVDYKKYNNSAVFLLGKKDSGKFVQNNVPLSFFHPNIETDWVINENKVRHDTDSTNQLPFLAPYYLLDEENPYGPEFRFSLSQIEDPYAKYVRVNLVADLLLDGQLTVAVSGIREGEDLMYRNEIFWRGVDVERMLHSSGQGYFVFKIPTFIRKDDILKISCWNRNPRAEIRIRSIDVLVYDNIWN